jgi:hypothetical protein
VVGKAGNKSRGEGRLSVNHKTDFLLAYFWGISARMEHTPVKFQKVYISGNPFKADLPAVLRVSAHDPDVLHNLVCTACGEPARPDEALARQFRSSQAEVAGKKTSALQSPPDGFSHSHPGAFINCPHYFAKNLPVKLFPKRDTFDARAIEPNRAALESPGKREAIAAVERFLLHRLTGFPTISPNEREKLDNIQKRLLPMVGLADQLWLLGYLGPLLLGERLRPTKGGLRWVVYTGVRDQKLLIQDLDGRERSLHVPQMLGLCYLRKDGTPYPVLDRGIPDKPIRFKVSPDFAEKQARDALKAEAANAQGRRKPVRRRRKDNPNQLKLAL